MLCVELASIVKRLSIERSEFHNVVISSLAKKKCKNVLLIYYLINNKLLGNGNRCKSGARYHNK